MQSLVHGLAARDGQSRPDRFVRNHRAPRCAGSDAGRIPSRACAVGCIGDLVAEQGDLFGRDRLRERVSRARAHARRVGLDAAVALPAASMVRTARACPLAPLEGGLPVPRPAPSSSRSTTIASSNRRRLRHPCISSWYAAGSRRCCRRLPICRCSTMDRNRCTVTTSVRCSRRSGCTTTKSTHARSPKRALRILSRPLAISRRRAGECSICRVNSLNSLVPRTQRHCC